MDELRIVSGLDTPERAGTSPPASGSLGDAFAKRLGAVIEQASQAQQGAEAQARELAAGRGDTVETMVALTKADLALRFVVNLRNRALEAYQELMRLQF